MLVYALFTRNATYDENSRQPQRCPHSCARGCARRQLRAPCVPCTYLRHVRCRATRFLLSQRVSADGKSDSVYQRATQAHKRTYLWHVAFICDDPALQHLLPQVFIGNEHTLKAGAFTALRAACPPKIRVLKRKSAWVDAPLIGTLVRWLSAALAPHMEVLQSLLYMDACWAHTHRVVFNACRASGVCPVIVPARLTWLLQPLDTHVFLIFKIALQKACQEARVRSAEGDLDINGLAACVRDTIVRVLEGRPWTHAFYANGFGPHQAGVRASVVARINASTPLDVPVARPTAEQLAPCFPRRTRIPTTSIWSLLDAPTGVGALPKLPPPPAPRRSVRIAILARPQAPAAAPPTARRRFALRGKASPPVHPSSLLGARSKSLSAPPSPAAVASRAHAAGASVVGAAPAAAPPKGIMTRSRTRELLRPPP